MLHVAVCRSFWTCVRSVDWDVSAYAVFSNVNADGIILDDWNGLVNKLALGGTG